MPEQQRCLLQYPTRAASGQAAKAKPVPVNLRATVVHKSTLPRPRAHLRRVGERVQPGRRVAARLRRPGGVQLVDRRQEVGGPRHAGGPSAEGRLPLSLGGVGSAHSALPARTTRPPGGPARPPSPPGAALAWRAAAARWIGAWRWWKVGWWSKPGGVGRQCRISDTYISISDVFGLRSNGQKRSHLKFLPQFTFILLLAC